MKDYALHIKIKNNYLLTMMKQHDITTAAELSRVSGVDQNGIGSILNLKTPAYTTKGEMVSDVRKLCDFFHCTPDDIFPERHLQESLPVNKVFMEANAEDLVPVYARLGSQDPLDLLLEEEQAQLEHDALAYAASTITPIQRAVLEFRYGVGPDPSEGFTQTQTAEIMGLSKTRIGQIEDKALTRLRNPGRGLQKLRE